MGQEIVPAMNQAITSAMLPISTHIQQAMSDLKSNSQTGMTDLLKEFGETVRGGAGAEMTELANTLSQMEKTLAAMQNDLRGSGEDFGRRMAEASEQLQGFIQEAGRSFGQSTGESRDALASVVAMLKETMERANADVAAGLGAAAGGASAKLEEAMGAVMTKLDGQIGALGERLGAMQGAMEQQAQAAGQTTAQVTVAQGRIQESLAAAMEDIGARLNRAVEQAVGLIAERFDALGRQMQGVEMALGNQRSALEGTASQARMTADAFSNSAQEIRVATAPLVQVGDRFATASESMSGNIEGSVRSLRQVQTELTQLAGVMQDTNGQTQTFWTDFKAKFDQVDMELGRAVETLSTATADQSALLRKQVTEIDTGLAQAIGKLNPFLDGLKEAAAEISDRLSEARNTPVTNGQGGEVR
jgi:DNA anti-recombination protein RmuC